MFCIQCGKKNLDGARYCFACGTLVAAAVEPAARSAAATSGGEAAAARVSASPTQASLAGKRCLSCGLFNPASAERCDCGFNFISGAVATLAGTRYAGFWIRVAASVLDGFVIGGLSVLGALVFGVAGMATEAAAEFAAAGYYIVSILASWLYYAICESSARQATLGKRAVGIIVTDLSGRPLSFGRASGRAFAKWLNALTLGIGWIVAAFSEQKRGLHDFVAGTLVVQSDPARKAGPMILVVLCVLGAVPVVGIVAAIAVPGLLRARMSGNEASAIGALRTINRAQEEYASRCQGYAPALPVLRLAGNLMSADLTAAETVTKSGYEFTLLPASGAQVVVGAPLGCDGAVTQYVARAVPVTPGTTGIRFFATNSAGTIYQDTSAAFDTATPLD